MKKRSKKPALLREPKTVTFSARFTDATMQQLDTLCMKYATRDREDKRVKHAASKTVVMETLIAKAARAA